MPSRREEAVDLLRDARRGAAARQAEIARIGYPAYTTSAGWLGYCDAKVEARVPRGDRAHGFDAREDEGRRPIAPTTAAGPRLIRGALGPRLRADDGRRTRSGASTRRSRAMRASLPSPEPWWIEEPTSPDDVLGPRADPRARSRRSASRPARQRPEPASCSSSSSRRRRSDVCQIDACRLGRRERGARRAAAGREIRRARSARTRAASGCASTSSTSRWSTTSPSARSLDGPGGRVGRPPARALPRARASCATGGTSPPDGARLQRSRCCPASLDEPRDPRPGPVWSPVEIAVGGE